MEQRNQLNSVSLQQIVHIHIYSRGFCFIYILSKAAVADKDLLLLSVVLLVQISKIIYSL